jgi:hypothetical protein
MTIVNVQFSDATSQTVVAFFSSPQDENSYPYQGQVDTTDDRYKAFYNTLNPVSARATLPAPT